MDNAIGVHIIDRWTYYALEFLEKVTSSSQSTLADFVSDQNTADHSFYPVRAVFNMVQYMLRVWYHNNSLCRKGVSCETDMTCMLHASLGSEHVHYQ